MPFRFFDLPRELRDKIYKEMLLSSPPPLPSSPQAHGPRSRVIEQSPIPGSLFAPKVLLPRLAASFLPTSHRVYEEIYEASTHLITMGKISRRLDILIGAGRQEFFPTWINLPDTARAIPRLDIELRWSEMEKRRPFVLHSKAVGSLAYEFVQNFLKLLWRYVQNGPRLATTFAEPKKTVIDQVILNITTTPGHGPGDPYRYMLVSLFHQCDMGIFWTEYFVEETAKLMVKAVRRPFAAPAVRVRKLILHVDGQEKQCLDMTRLGSANELKKVLQRIKDRNPRRVPALRA